MNKWVKCFRDIKKGFKRGWKDYKNGTFTPFSMYPKGTIFNEKFFPIYVPEYEVVFNTINRIDSRKLILNEKYLKQTRYKNVGINLDNIYIFIPEDDANRVRTHMTNVVISVFLLENKTPYINKEIIPDIMDIFDPNIRDIVSVSNNNIIDILESICREVNKSTNTYRFFVCDNTKSKLYREEYPNKSIIDLMVDLSDPN